MILTITSCSLICGMISAHVQQLREHVVTCNTRYRGETHNLMTAMGFGDLKTSAGLSALNDYLADKSYIEG